MVIGILAVMSVGLSDAYFLGQYGAAELAAVGFIYPVTIAVTSLALGLSAGINTVVSQAIGQKDTDFAQRASAQGLIFALLLGVLTGALLLVVAEPLFALMGARSDAADAVCDYVFYWALSFPLLVILLVINAVFRAHGSSTIPAGLMVLVAAVNVGINPVLIFGLLGVPEGGAGGAGLATLIARLLGVVLAVMYVLIAGYIERQGLSMKGCVPCIKKIARVGVPAAFSNAINPAGMAIITALVAAFGEAAVGGFGAATRIQSFIMVPLLALSSGIGPVVGQNWGADERDRVGEAMRVAFISCLTYGLVVGLGLVLMAETLMGIMTDDQATLDYGAAYMQFVGLTLFGYGILVVANAAKNARDRAFHALTSSVIRIAIIYVPLAALGSWWLGYQGILIAAIIANLFGAYLAVIICYQTGLLRDGPVIFTGPARLLTSK